MNSCSKQTAYAIVLALALLAPALGVHTAVAATDLSSLSFVIDPALPVGDPITSYDPVAIGDPFTLPGGAPLDIGVNDFTYPAARLGKFIFNATEVNTLFPVVGSDNGLAGIALEITMAITDLDTNGVPGGTENDSDYLDIIFALSLTNADDGSTLARVLTDDDGGGAVAPQFITGFGNQPLDDPPDIATNVYNLSATPVLGSDLAEMFSLSGGEIWLYLIDTDDAGNKISLANSLAEDFSITVSFEPVVIPIPPAIVMFASAAIAMVMVRRRRT